jgi:hypothetical protein
MVLSSVSSQHISNELSLRSADLAVPGPVEGIGNTFLGML